MFVENSNKLATLATSNFHDFHLTLQLPIRFSLAKRVSGAVSIRGQKQMIDFVKGVDLKK